MLKNYARFLLIVLIVLMGEQLYAQNCTINAGTPQTICENATLTLVGTRGGSSTAPTLWTQVEGPSATITSPTSLTTTVSNLVGGNTYKFRLATTCSDGSLISDEVSITVRAITKANAGADVAACPGTNVVTLVGTSIAAGESAAWAVQGTNNGVTIINGTAPSTGITLNGANSGATTIRYTITSTQGCSSFDDVVVTNRGGVSTVSAGADVNLDGCYSGSRSIANLSGSFGGGGAALNQQGTWLVVSGPNLPTFSNKNQHNSGLSNLIAGTYILRWTVAGACVNGNDETQITVAAAKGAVTKATIAPTGAPFCDGRTSTLLVGSSPIYANEVVTWNRTAGSGTLSTPKDLTTNTISGLTSSNTSVNYQIRNTVTGCSSTSSAVTLSTSTAPSITITTPSPYRVSCGTSSAVVAFTTTGSISAREYSVISGPAPGTYPSTWKTIASGTTNILSGYTSPGTYLVRLRAVPSGNACATAFADITIIVSGNASLSNAGTDQILACNVFNTQLAGNSIANGVGSWTQIAGPNSATIDNPSAYNANITNLVAGKYTFKWYVSNGTTCPSSEDLVDVIVSAPSPTTSVVGANTSSCAGSVVYLEGNTPVRNEVGTWSVSPSAGVVISDIHNPVAAVTNLLNNTNYTFTWTISNACGTSASSYSIATSSTAGASIANAGADKCLAAGTTSATLAGNNPTSGTGTWSQISGPNSATIANTSLYNSGVTGLQSGTYKFEWKIAKAGCTATRDTVVISVGNPTTANAGADNFSLCGTSVTLAGNNPALGSGMWTQISGVTQASFADPKVHNSTASGLASGRYTFRWTVSNGACTSSSDDVVIIASTPPSAAAAGDDFSVCNASNATLAATAPTTGAGVWAIVSGPNTPTFGNVASPTSSITGLASGVYTLRWKVSAGETCPSTSDDVVVTVLPAAVVTNSNESFCSIDNANLVGNMVIGASGVTYTWTNVSGPNTPTITNQNAAGNIAKATGLIPGTYTFQYAINAGTCSVSATKTVTIDQMPSLAEAGTLDKSFCAANSVVMNANTPSSGIGTWSALTFPAGATINYTPNNSAPNATISLNKTGTYVFTWKVVSGTCTNQQNVTVQNDPAPSIANAGLDQTNVCGTSALLAANAPTAGVGTWSVISGPSTPTFDSQMLNNALVSNMIPGDYTLRWTISSGAICTAKTDDVKLTIKDLPTTANAGADQSLCNIYTTQLQANTLSGGTTGMWTKQSGPASISFDDPTNPTATISSLTQGTYVLRWTTTLGTCTSFDEVTINVYNPPSTAVVPADFSYCLYGANPSLSATLPVDGNGAWSKVSGGNVLILSPNSNTTSLAGISTAGDYIFKWTVTNGTCLISEAEVKMTVKQPVTPANAGVSQSLYKKTAAVLAANTPTSGVGMWSIVSKPSGAPDPSFSDLSNPTATITGLQPGDYILRWTIDNGGCSSSDDVEIYNTLVPSVSVNDATATEGSNLTFTLTLSNASGVATSVGYTTAVNAGAGYADNSDFTASAGTVTFLPGEVSKTITIATNDDNIYEGTETFDLNLSSPTELTISDSKGVGTITDNEAKPTITVTTGISATEGQELAFKILLSHPCSSTITVTRKTQDGTAATADGDYTAIASSVVTIPAGTTSLDVPVYTTVDAKFEPNETVSLVLSAPSGNATLGAPSTGVGTILNDDAKPKVSIDNQTIVEGGSLTFNVTLTNPSSQAISAAYSAASGSAVMGTDFANVPSGTISFAPGETSKTITVSSLQDVIDEDDEQFSITLSSLTNVDAGTLVGVGTITDNDAAPSLSISDASTAEGGKLSFTITLSAASEKTVTVTAASADGSATAADNDYTALASTIVTFAPGETSKVVEVQTSDDGKYEGNEDILLNLSLAANATIADAQGVGTITDEADKPSLSIADAVSVNEGGDLSFRVSLSNLATSPVSVFAKTADGSATSADNDYTSLGLTKLTIPALASFVDVVIHTTGDATFEADEDLFVQLSNPSSNASIAADKAKGIILNDDAKPKVSIDNQTIVEGGSLTFNVTLTNPSSQAISAAYSAASGTAIMGTDFANVPSGTISFAPGETSKTITVSSLQDVIDEDDEQFSITLSSLTNVDAGTLVGVGTITDNDAAPSLSISDASTAEGGKLSFTITLSAASEKTVTVTAASADGSATTADNDYTALASTIVTFAPGETSKVVEVQTSDDGKYEGNEDILLNLSLAANATIADAQGVGTITDEADKPEIAIDPATTAEGGNLSFRIWLSKPATAPVTVSYKTSDFAAAIGKASGGTDYTAAPLTAITFAAGTTEQTVVVASSNDDVYEGDETFKVELSGASANSTISATAGVALGTITDEADKPTITVSDASIAEGGNLEFVVSLSNAAVAPVTVECKSEDYLPAADGKAAGGTDYQIAGLVTLTFPANSTASQTVTVHTTNDTRFEGDEIMKLVLANSSSNSTISKATAVGTITDAADYPSLSITGASIAEGGSLGFVVTLSNESYLPITAKYSTSDGTAKDSDSDYTPVNLGTITFAAGTTALTTTVNVATINNNIYEGDETLNVTLSDATNATISATGGAAEGTITDEADKPSLSIADAVSVNEGGDLSFRVSLSNLTATPVTVFAKTTDGSATSADNDYTSLGLTKITIPALAGFVDVVIHTTADATFEADEDLFVQLSNPSSNASIAADKAKGIILNDDTKPTVSIANVSASEGDPLVFEVKLSNPSDKIITVDYTESDVTATSGTDFTALPSGLLTFNPGEVVKLISVQTTLDALDEADETFTIALSNLVNVDAGSVTAVGTIIDVNALPTLSVGDATVAEGGKLQFVVSLSAASGKAISVKASTADGSATTADNDYTSVSNLMVTFAPGEVSKVVEVPTTADTKFESDETISLNLTDASNATIADGSATGTITNDDTKPTVAVGSPTVTEGGVLAFVVSLSNPSDQAISVGYTVEDGTATMGTDFDNVPAGTLSFAAGETSKTVLVPTTDDALNEDSEQLSLKLNSLVNVDPDKLVGVGTILDNDGAPTLSVGDATVAEGGKLQFVVSLSAASGKAVSVKASSADGSATTADNDYTSVSNLAVTFAPGEVSKVVEVPTTADTKFESDETIALELTDATNATIADGSATGTITNDDTKPTVAVGSPTVTEGGVLAFVVSLSNPSDQAISVGYTVEDGTATMGTDFDNVPAGTLTFAAGETSKTVLVPTTDDALNEDSEQLSLKLGSLVNVDPDKLVGVGTILDNDGAPTLSVGDATVAEGGKLQFVVSLSAASGKAVSVKASTADGSATTADNDYTSVSNLAVTFAPGEVSKVVEVPTTADTKFESDETISLELTDATNATIADGSATGTITNDDTKPTVAVGSPTVTEGGVLAFVVSLSNPSDQAISVGYTLEDGTATMGTDFDNVPAGTLSFAAGETSKTVLVPTTDDALNEDSEQLSLKLNSLVNVDPDKLVGVGTILDNDGAPTLSVGDATVAEGGKLQFVVSLSAASGKAVTIKASTADGSATTADNDYTSVSNLAVTFALGEVSKVVEVPTTADTKFESDETISLELTDATNATIADGSATGTITNDDTKPTVAVGSPTVTEGGVLAFVVSLSNPSDQAISAGYTVEDGTATMGTDFDNVPAGTLTFAAGETSKTVLVPTTDDALNEDSEQLSLKLGSLVNVDPDKLVGVGTILDNDGAPTLSVGDATVAEGGKLQFVVSLSAASGKVVSVKVSSADGSATTADNDYTSVSNLAVTFAPGEVSKVVEVPTTADTKFESDETISLELTDATNATIADGSATGTITNDDTKPTVAVGSPTVTEGGVLAFVVSLSNPSDQAISAGYTVEDGTATMGTDFDNVPAGTLSFAAGETSKTVLVPTTDDALNEDSEQLSLKLGSLINVDPDKLVGVGTILDNDGAPTLSVGDATVAEGGKLQFVVSLSSASGKAVTVKASTADGSATTADNDYTSVSNLAVTFAPGEVSKVVEVPTTADTKFESDETISLELTDATNATIADGNATGTITNDDAKPTISIANVSASEGDPLVFEVRLSNPSDKIITVDYTESDVTATSGTDFTALPSGSLTFNPGEVVKLISVQTKLDALDEADETFTIALSNLVNVDAGSVTAVGTIIDVNALPTLSVGDATVAEGGKLQFVVSLSAASGKAVSVKASTADGSATTADNDYTSVSNLAVTFAPGEVSKVVEVPTTADTKFENDETISLELTDATNATIADGNATGTITNDDTKPTVAVGSPTVTEGGVLAFVVSLSNPSDQAISVGYTLEDGTATMGTDFDNIPAGTLTFAAGETSKTVLVPTTDDALNEDSEQLSLKLNSLVNVDPDKLVGVGTILDNDGAPTLSVGDATVAEGGKLQFVVSLSAASGKEVTVKASSADGSATTADNDYTSVSNLAVTFAPGEVSKVVEVPTTADTKFESDETISLELTDATNATIADGNATGTITNDDIKPTVAVGSPTVTEGGVLAFVVSLSNPSDQAISVGYTAEDGTATMGADFDNVPAGTLTFAAGETSKTVLVSTTDDALNEDSEQLSLKLNSLVNVDPDKLVGVGTILDNDGAPTLSVGDATVAEGGKLQFVVSLSAASGKAVSVKASTADGSATITDNDYTAASNLAVTFAPGETSKVVEVPTTADTKFESNETISLNLTDATNATIADGNATGTITNDDATPAISVADATAIEGDKLRFRITLDKVSDNEVSVNIGLQDITTSSSDYSALPSTTVTFAAGDLEKWVEVSTLKDAIVEGNEQVKLVLSSATNATIAVPEAIGTITDVMVKPLNFDFEVSGTEDSPVSISKNGFADNFDKDYKTELLKVKIESLPENGSLVLNGSPVKVGDEISSADLDMLTFIPSPNWNGETSFKWKGQNSAGYADVPAVVTIKIAGVNDLPEATNDSFMIDEKALLSGNVAANDKLSGDGGNTFTLVGLPAHGEVILNSDGSFTYTQKGGYAANDSFTYKLCDANGDCSTASVNIVITQIINNIKPPVAANDNATTKGDTPVTISVLANDSDPDSQLLPETLTILDQPQHGTVVVNGDETVTYTANKGYVGEDTFTYRICDNGNPQMCATATVNVTVTGLDVKIPDGFSPNGDGVNDRFVIKGLETYPNNVLRIFNRWGNIVYQMKGYDNSWDGKNGGKGLHIGVDLPDGTYYYILDLGDGSKPQTSFVVIKR